MKISEMKHDVFYPVKLTAPIITQYAIAYPAEVLVTHVYYNRYGESSITFLNLSTGTMMSGYVAPVYIFNPSDKEVELRRAYKQWQIANLISQLGHYFYVGSDPEIFFEVNGQVLPAYDFLPAKKDAKYSNAINKERGYWDGFQAEFETNAVSCLAYHVDSIYRGLKICYNAAVKHNNKARPSVNTVMDIPPHLLESGKQEHVQFGCMPSFNVYNIVGMQDDGRDVPFRPAGGHIHFGIGPKDTACVERIVKALDAILGVACVSMFARWDDPRRRHLYGLPGEYRLPAHGLEYRTLSNAWLFHPAITHLVFDVARKVLMIGEKDLLSDIWKADEKEVVRVIRETDVDGARRILDANKDTMMRVLQAAYREQNTKLHEAAYKAFRYGVEELVPQFGDITSNWELNTNKWMLHSGTGRAQFGHWVASLLAKKAA